MANSQFTFRPRFKPGSGKSGTATGQTAGDVMGFSLQELFFKTD